MIVTPYGQVLHTKVLQIAWRFVSAIMRRVWFCACARNHVRSLTSRSNAMRVGSSRGFWREIPVTVPRIVVSFKVFHSSLKVCFLDDIFQPSPMLSGVCVADDLFQSSPVQSSPVQRSDCWRPKKFILLHSLNSIISSRNAASTRFTCRSW